MSEAEKKRRREYRLNRKKRIMIFSLILCGLVLLSAVFGIVYRALDDTLFVSYSETSNIAYKVKLFPNEYLDEWQNQNQSYVADLTDEVQAEFVYTIAVDEPDVTYFYTESVTITLVVADRTSKVPIYQPVDVIKVPTSAAVEGNTHLLNTVTVDYDAYRAQAAEFIDAYKLTNVDAYVSVTMRVDTVGNRTYSMPKTYESTLKLPLIDLTFRPETTSSVPMSAMQYLECEAGVAVKLFLVLTGVFSCLSVLGAAFLACFIYFTRNEDINYAVRVKRLIASYKSFIQEITTPFAQEGYQLVYIKNFNEMLEVRDTVGSPLLMYENEDATATSFVIPSNMGILYCYEIRVEDYDDIYGTGMTPEAILGTEKDDNFFVAFFKRIIAFFKSDKEEAKPVIEATEETEVTEETEATDETEVTEETEATDETEVTEETEEEAIPTIADAEEEAEAEAVEDAPESEPVEDTPIEETSAEETSAEELKQD